MREWPLSLKRWARRTVGNIIRAIPWTRRLVFASTDYQVLTHEEALADERSAGWLDRLTARRQQRAYNRLLFDLRGGKPRIDFIVAADAVSATNLHKPSLLEIGCGGGYYSEVFGALLHEALDYCGVDYSQVMVEQAKRSYPLQSFRTADACTLPFDDDSFDIVFNGVSLMHIPDTRGAISESRRVARRFCIYHSVPVFAGRETTWFRKFAYGAPVIEVVFNRNALLALFEEEGLELVQSWQSIEYDVHPAVSEHSTGETFLLKIGDTAPPSRRPSL